MLNTPNTWSKPTLHFELKLGFIITQVWWGPCSGFGRLSLFAVRNTAVFHAFCHDYKSASFVALYLLNSGGDRSCSSGVLLILLCGTAVFYACCHEYESASFLAPQVGVSTDHRTKYPHRSSHQEPCRYIFLDEVYTRKYRPCITVDITTTTTAGRRILRVLHRSFLSSLDRYLVATYQVFIWCLDHL